MMKQFRINIDGKEVTALPGQTILQVARENDIYIPTLCYDDRMEIYGACGLCVVELEGNPKLWKACATEVSPNMVVRTKSKRIEESRKTNLELLLSNHVGDCRPPCVRACPAHTDCQGYVGLIAEGRYREAIELTKEKIPIPASIGRVCPHPCEKECRRGLVDEPISIMHLKAFAADQDLDGDSYLPQIDEETGKKVAVIGAGPYGLSVAYFLRQMGHAVTIYEAMPHAGGMLRYGIPEYRLPKEILEEEVDLIRETGVEIITNTRVGTDISFEKIRRENDAVCIGIGAWKSTGTRCEGEDLPGVLGGIDFLGMVERGERFIMGKKVAIVGGGNTAMDACRTAVRLGAEKVYNIYRRTVDEMPADEIEIGEATEEGVIFKNLRNPLQIHPGEDGRVGSMTLQVMELGEPDASGRRAPRPVKGATEDIEVDMVIAAIGQAVNPDGINGVELTRKNGIIYDPETFMTALDGVFAGGDCGNDKISIAIESIADARKSSYVIDSYLAGETIAYKPEYNVIRTDITRKTFEDRERECRPTMATLTPEERKDNFVEVIKGYTPEQAGQEAMRCLECGCKSYFDCKLVEYANQYDVHPERIAGEIHKTEYENTFDYDPNKCILCGLCVRSCDEVMGVGALGLVGRGFETVVLPAMGMSHDEAGCIHCGQCVSLCPTGALHEHMPGKKQIPVATEETGTICGFCSVGCSIKVQTCGQLPVKTQPDPEGAVNHGVLCKGGKFGYLNAAANTNKITTPLERRIGGGALVPTNYHDAFVLTAKSFGAAALRYGFEAAAIAVSDRFTTEEAYAAKKLAEQIGIRIFSFNNRDCGLKDTLGLESSPNTMDELLSTDVILAIGYDPAANEVSRIKLMQAAKNGAKIILINPEDTKPAHMPFIYDAVYTEDNLEFLKEIAKALLEKADPSLQGYATFKNSLSGSEVSEKAGEIAGLYAEAKKAMIVFQQNRVSVSCAKLIGDLAVLSGHIGGPRDGILMLKSKNNSEGLTQLGITAGPEVLDSGIKALLVFGEAPDPEIFKDMEFVMVSDTHMSPAAAAADVVIPGTGPVHASGTYINTERRMQRVSAPLAPEVPFTNLQIIRELAEALEYEFPYEDDGDVAREMSTGLSWYRNTSDGETIGGYLTPEKHTLSAVVGNTFTDVMPNTDYLKELI